MPSVPQVDHITSLTFFLCRAVPNGGYVAAVILRAASLHMTTTHSHRQPVQEHTVTFHGMFMIKTNAGVCDLKVEDTKIGRGYSTLHISLLQEGMTCVNAYVTMTNIDAENGPTIETYYKKPLPKLLGRKNVDKLLTSEGVPGWYERPKPFADFRTVSKRARFFTSKEVEPGLITNWACFTDPKESITNDALPLIADLFVGLIEQLDPDGWDDSGEDKNPKGPKAKYWYPTITLSLDIKKALPKEGVKWVYSHVQSKQIKNGRWDLQVVIMDEEGELVAYSSQVALMVDASRNTKPRGKRENGEAKL